MSYNRFDVSQYCLGRVPAPSMLLRLYSFEKGMTSFHPLLHNQGLAVIVIGYEPFSVHPVAIYRPDGTLSPIPHRGLKPSTRTDLPFEIEAHIPLRSVGDTNDVALCWVRVHVDGLPYSSQF